MVSLGVTPSPTMPCRKREVLGEDRVVQRHLLVDRDRRRLEVDGPVGVAEVDLDVALDLLDAAQLVDEVHVPRAAAKLAVGGRLQPDVALHLHAPW